MKYNHQSKKYYVFENEMKLYNKLSEEVPDEKFHHIWSLYVLTKILTALPDKRFLRLANQNLSPSTKDKFFKAGFGSIRFYLIRLTVTQYIRFLISHFMN